MVILCKTTWWEKVLGDIREESPKVESIISRISTLKFASNSAPAWLALFVLFSFHSKSIIEDFLEADDLIFI